MILATLVWLVCWLADTRYALLDDALIHLHYAHLLHQEHFITYDGIEHSFGTSSLLYVSLLAVLSGFFTSPLLPKEVAVCAYLVLVAVVLGQIFRVRRSTLAQALLFGLLLCLLTPMGIRWLTDGMETSLTVLFTLLLVIVVKSRQASSRVSSPLQYLLFVLFGAALVYLRIELAMLVALCSLGILVSDRSQKRSFTASVIDASPLSVGAVLAMLSVRIIFGHFLPDTALAKSGHASLSPIITSLQVLVSSFAFGIGSAFCWLLSVILLLRRNRIRAADHTKSLLLLIENAPILIIVALSCLRGQAIQGVRYLEWTFVFSIAANSLEIWRSEPAASPAPLRLAAQERNLVIAGLLIFCCMLPFDWKFAAHAEHGRAETFLEMRSAHLSEMFSDKVIVGSDVGFITYFSNGRMCDLAGLVSGRKLAAMTIPQRASYCTKQSPAMMFLTTPQLRNIAPFLPLDQWTVCGIFDFTNVNSNDRHYLVVPSFDAQRVCSTLNFSPRPARDFLPAS